MALPEQPVTLTAEEIAALHSALREMRHGINNYLAVVQGTFDAIRIKPAQTDYFLNALRDRTPTVKQTMQDFSDEFERRFGIKRD